MPQLRLALAQVNPTVGDLAGNADLDRRQRSREAAEAGAHLVVFPEMVLTGYPIEDLALRAVVRSRPPAPRRSAGRAARRGRGLGDLAVVVGFLDQRRRRRSSGSAAPRTSPQNAVAVLHGGEVVARQAKHHLSNYGVFDEIRNFVPGDTINIVQVRRRRRRARDLRGPLAGRPVRGGRRCRGRPARRPERLAVRAQQGRRPARAVLATGPARAICALAYVNLVGGQDELVFDGDSIVVDADGELLARAAQFEPELLVVDLDLPAATADDARPATGSFGGLSASRGRSSSSEPVAVVRRRWPPGRAERSSDLAEIYHALVLGLRDYVRKNGFRSVLMGLSGGIDSTLVGAIAVRRARARRTSSASPTRATGRPSTPRPTRPSSPGAPGLQLDTVPIAPMFDALPGGGEGRRARRGEPAGPHPRRHLDGAVQPARPPRARLRQQERARHRLLDDLRRRGRRLRADQGRARRRWSGSSRGGATPTPSGAASSRRSRRTPSAKPPSAELRPGQLDTDSLPPYDLLDAILDAYVERDLGAADLVAAGLRPAPWSSGSSRWSTGPSTSAASTRRARRSPRATSAATAACRSPTAGANTSDPRGVCLGTEPGCSVPRQIPVGIGVSALAERQPVSEAAWSGTDR